MKSQFFALNFASSILISANALQLQLASQQSAEIAASNQAVALYQTGSSSSSNELAYDPL